MTPHELLARRYHDYKKAEERHLRALEAQARAEQRVPELESELADVEEEDRRVLGDALAAGTKPPAEKAERVRARLKKARDELVALQDAAQRSGQVLDRLPREHGRVWRHEAMREFEAARAAYEQRLGLLAEDRKRLEEEAQLLNFLGETNFVRVPHTVRVIASGVQGLTYDVVIPDLLEALRDDLANIEINALLGARA